MNSLKMLNEICVEYVRLRGCNPAFLWTESVHNKVTESALCCITSLYVYVSNTTKMSYESQKTHIAMS